MPDDLPEGIGQFQRQAEALRRFVADAQAAAPPSAVGADRTGAVRVTLAPDGLPQEIRVAPGWRRLLQPGALADAVREAVGAATRARLAAWNETIEAGDWAARARRIMRGGGPPAAVDEVPAAFRAAPTGTPRRDLSALSEELVRSLERIDEIARSSPALAEVTGRSATGAVSIALSRAAGVTRCAIDVRWAARVETADLNGALAQALASARAGLVTAAARPAPADGLMSMFTEAAGLLRDPQRLA